MARQAVEVGQETLRVQSWSARRSIALVALSLFAGTAARSAFSPIQELARADIGLTDNQLALLQGFAVALPLALVSIPIGRLVDRSNRAKLLVALALLFAVGSALTAFAHTFTTMLIARMIVGGAVAGAIPASISLGADLSTTLSRGRVTAVLGLGQILGSAATFALVGVLLEVIPKDGMGVGTLGALAPWRLVQLVFAGCMLVLTLFLTLLREPPRHERGSAQGAPLGETLREMKRYARLLVPLGIGLVTISMADAAAGIWVVPVLTRFFHQQPADFGGWIGLAFLVSGIVGTLAGGALADYGQRKAGPGGVLITAALAAAISLPAAFFPMMPSVTSLAWLFGLLLGAGACASVVATSAVAILLPNELRGLSLSLMTAVGLVIAYGAAPSLVSLIAQAVRSGEDIRTPLALVGAVSSAIGFGAFLVAMRIAREPVASSR